MSKQKLPFRSPSQGGQGYFDCLHYRQQSANRRMYISRAGEARLNNVHAQFCDPQNNPCPSGAACFAFSGVFSPCLDDCPSGGTQSTCRNGY